MYEDKNFSQKKEFYFLFSDFIELRGGLDNPKAPLSCNISNKYHTKWKIVDPPLLEFCSSYGGVLKSDFVCVDIDSEDEAALLLSIVKGEGLHCVVLKTTRGMHFYFQYPKGANITNASHRISRCTLCCDYKSNFHKVCSYLVLKLNGAFREVIYSNATDGLDPLPTYLYPTAGGDKVLATNTFKGITEGNRHMLLATVWKPFLLKQSPALTTEEVNASLEIINRYFFASPLSLNEMTNIEKDERFNPKFVPTYKVGANKTEKKESESKTRARFLINQARQFYNAFHIKAIKTNSEPLYYYYEENHYKYMTDRQMSSLVSVQINKADEDFCLSQRDLNNYVLPTIKNEVAYQSIEEESLHARGEFYIATKNRLIKIIPKTARIEIMEHTPDVFCTNYIPVEYKETTQAGKVDAFLLDIANGDKEISNLLNECIGYTLLPKNIFRKAFFLIGKGGNGKSTFLNLLTTFIGRTNTSNVTLDELQNNRFASANLKDKLLNTGDDIAANRFMQLDKFKAVVSGDTIQGEYKGAQAFSFVPFCKMFFSANEAPKIKEHNIGITSRLIFIPFKRCFLNSNGGVQKKDFISEITTEEELSRLLFLSLNALRGLLERGDFSQVKAVQDFTEETLTEGDNIYDFCKEYERDGGTFDSVPVKDVYEKYLNYLQENNIQQNVTLIIFSKRIRNLYANLEKKLIRKDKKPVQCFYWEGAKETLLKPSEATEASEATEVQVGEILEEEIYTKELYDKIISEIQKTIFSISTKNPLSAAGYEMDLKELLFPKEYNADTFRTLLDFKDSIAATMIPTL